MNYAKKAVIGSIFIFSTSVLAQFFGYVARLILARNLSTEQFGLFYSIFTFFMFLSVFTDLGYGAALTKYIAEFKAKNLFSHLRKSFFCVFLIKLFLSLFLSLLVFSLAGFLAKYYFKFPDAIFSIKVISVLLFFYFFIGMMSSVFIGFQRMFYAGLVNLLHKFFFFFFVVLFFLLGFSKTANTPIHAFVLSILLPFLLLSIPALRMIKMNVVENVKISHKKLIRKISAFALPSMLTSLSGFIIGYIDVIILTALMPLSDVGIYNGVLPTALILVAISGALGSVMFPMVTEMNAKNEINRLKSGIKKIYVFVLLGILPLSLIVVSFPKLILRILFGEAYISGALSLQILVIGIVFFSVAQINNSILLGLGHPKCVMKITFFVAFFNVVFNLVLIPSMGIIGAALTTSLSYLLMLISSSFVIAKKIEMKFPFFDWFKILFSGIIFIFMIFLSNNLLPFNFYVKGIIGIFAGAIIYYFICNKFKLVSIGDILKIFKNK